MIEARGNRIAIAVVFAALLGCLAAPAADAATSHPALFSIFYFPSLADAEYLEDPCGVAVRPDEGLYVADYYHDQILSFDSGGGYLSAVPGLDPADGPCGLAADAGGDLFVDEFHGAVVREDPLGATEVVDPGPATGVAFDPGSGHVYVDDRDHVAVYEESGLPVEVGGEPLRIGLGNLAEGFGVAVSDHPGSEGFVYVADAATGTIKVFDPATSDTTPVAEIDGRGDPQGGFATLQDAALAIDDATGDLFVAYNAQGPFWEHPAAAVAEFNPAGEYRGSLPVGPLLFGEPTGLAVDDGGGAGQGRVFVTSGNSQVLYPAEPGKPLSGKRQEGAVFAFGPTAPGQHLAVGISGAGTVTSAPAGIACPGACGAEYDEGATVTLTPTPSAGQVFEGWSGGCVGVGPCSVTMTGPTTVLAEFGLAPSVAGHTGEAGPGPGEPGGGAADSAGGPMAAGTAPAPAAGGSAPPVAAVIAHPGRRPDRRRHHRRADRRRQHHHGFRHRKGRRGR